MESKKPKNKSTGQESVVMREIDGIAVSQGIAIGHAFVLSQEVLQFPKLTILQENTEEEIRRFREALASTQTELTGLYDQLLQSAGEKTAEFLNMHIAVTSDPTFMHGIEDLIHLELKNAEWAAYEVIDSQAKKFLALQDNYLKQRAKDLHDIGKRILRHLMKKERADLSQIPANSILIAEDLDPSLTAMLDLSKVEGFVTNEGGKTSHTSILARSHNLPAVVGTLNATESTHNGDVVIVDSNTGKVIINPDAATLKLYKTARNVYEQHRHSLEQIAHLDAVTKDNRRIILAGNIEIPDEADTIIRNGGFGIGLYRTEFFYMNRPGLPSEDELFTTFKNVLEKMNPAPVIFRTIDLGGDKFTDTFLEQKNESNPFLGWRAIRFCLENREIFSTQLRAILRASAFGKAKIMIPMITNASEIIQTKQILENIKEELRSDKIPFDNGIEIGAMIEIPSAALTADSIAKEVSFFSIGSNDLVQYTLAVDRNNSKIAHLFDPFHPAVIQLLKMTIDSAKRHNIKISICGEIGSDPMAIPLLVGLGFDELSVSPSVIPDVKRLIRTMEYSYAKKISERILCMDNSVEIQQYLKTVVDIFAPDIMAKNK